ncbi:MAG TPA: glycine zipper 2TM domain-containing protein [Ramlibacter sp.]|nr:glycine zipper 2TM domain-containing protein [Ramlibacter sp.]
MRSSSRFIPVVSCAAVAAALAGCSYTRTVSLDAPPTAAVAVPAPPTVVTVPAAPVVVAPSTVEFGRVSSIEYFPGGTTSTRINVPGAIVGGVAGAVIGNQVGRAVGGRDAATVLGGAAGAAVGSRTGTTTTVIDPAYRVTIQTDAGAVRIYDVPATGDLRVGDRVRVDSGVIYRS